MILKILEVGPFLTNCYIVGDEATKDGMIIDPGDDADFILEQVKALELNIKTIVLTHGHSDHVCGVNEVKDATGAKFMAHGDERRMIQGSSRSLIGVFISSLPAPDRWLKSGDSIEVGKMQFKVLHTPGHSPGGISLVGEGVVFSGDTLFNHGIGRTDFDNGNFEQLIESIRTQLMVLPDETLVYPGHGLETTIGEERKSNPFLQE